MQLREKDQKEIIRLAKESFTRPVKIWAYGSRVSGMAHEGSDLDLVLLPDGYEMIDLCELRMFKDLLQESTIPILVQVLDWNRIPKSFQANVLKEYEVLL
jgi:predicted nucleotidyltransferase